MSDKRARFATIGFPEEDPPPSQSERDLSEYQLNTPLVTQPPETSPSASSSKSVRSHNSERELLNESLDWDPYGDVGTPAGVGPRRSMSDTGPETETSKSTTHGLSTLERIAKILTRPSVSAKANLPSGSNTNSESKSHSDPGPLSLSMIDQLPGLALAPVHSTPKPLRNDEQNSPQSGGSPDELDTIKPKDSESTEVTTPSAYDEEEEETSGSGQFSLEQVSQSSNSGDLNPSSQIESKADEPFSPRSHPGSLKEVDLNTLPSNSKSKHGVPTSSHSQIPESSESKLLKKNSIRAKASSSYTEKFANPKKSRASDSPKLEDRLKENQNKQLDLEEIFRSNSKPRSGSSNQMVTAISETSRSARSLEDQATNPQGQDPDSVEVEPSGSQRMEVSSDDEMNGAAPLNTTNQSLNRVVSEASTEWEYGHSRSQSIQENDHSPSSVSVTDWQNSGLTRSEIEYQKRRNNSSIGSGGSGGSYVMEVEIVAERRGSNVPNTNNSDPHHNLRRSQSVTGNPVLLVSKGVQTSTHDRKATSPKRKSKRKHGDETNHHEHQDRQGNRHYEDRVHRGDRQQHRGRHEHHPDRHEQPHYQYRDKHGHPHHQQYGSTKHEQPITESTSFEDQRQTSTTTNSSNSTGRLAGNYLEESEPSIHTSSSSGCMSPTCQLINQLVKTMPRSPHQLQKHDHDMYKAIAAHRATHLKKVRKEFNRVEHLNNILTGVKKLDKNASPHHTLDHRPHRKEEYRTSNVFKSGISTKNSTQKPALSARSPKKINAITSTTNPSVSGKVHVTSNTVLDTRNQILSALTAAVSTQIPTPMLSATASASSTNVNNSVEQKLDQLLSTFNFIADCLASTQESIVTATEDPGLLDTNTFSKKNKDKSQQTKSPTKKKKKPQCAPCKPVKPPVSFFIPYAPNTNPLNIRCRPILCHGASGYASGSEASSSGSDKSDKENRDGNQDDDERDRILECLEKMSLEDVCKQNNPHFIERVREREDIIAQIKAERETRAKIKREWVLTQGDQRMSSLERVLPPKGQRLMSEKEMKEITKKKYKQLPEVQQKKLQRKVEEEKKTNRLIANVFARKLRQNVLKGNMNIDLSKSIIRK